MLGFILAGQRGQAEKRNDVYSVVRRFAGSPILRHGMQQQETLMEL
jgi:hypothetical protein